MDGLSLPWRVHAVVPRSRANGPGLRFTIWSQGCTLGCPGCFNPDTHDPAGPARDRTVGAVVEAVLAEAPAIEGVTLTGGEPLQQPAAVTAFCQALRARAGQGEQGSRQGPGQGVDLSIVVLTGFTRAEVEADADRRAAVAGADMVVAGRYNRRRHLGAGLRGSDNKTYWALTGRYTPADFADLPELEVILTPDGGTVLTGMAGPAGGPA